MTKLGLLPLCLICFAAPAFAQARSSSSAEDASSAALQLSAPPNYSSAMSEEALSSEDASPVSEEPAQPPLLSSADAFKLFVESCADLASGDPTAFDRANDRGWIPNDSDDTGPYTTIYSGYRELEGFGEIDIWSSVQKLPTQRLGYCRLDFSDSDGRLDFNDVSGLKSLTGTVEVRDGGTVFGAWESADKKLLVVGDRKDGTVELEFNLLLGDKPAAN
ncbi:MAG: hypothetical protein ABI398_00795 [Devosia sp.]